VLFEQPGGAWVADAVGRQPPGQRDRLVSPVEQQPQEPPARGAGLVGRRRGKAMHNHHLTLQDVAEWPLIFFDRGSSDWTLTQSLFRRAGLMPNVVLEVETIEAAKRMVERALDGFALYPEKLIGDTGYGNAEMLNWLVDECGIEPHIPVWDKSQRTDGTFSRDDFTYDHTSGGRIRHGTKILRWREDKTPQECKLEQMR